MSSAYKKGDEEEDDEEEDEEGLVTAETRIVLVS